MNFNFGGGFPIPGAEDFQFEGSWMPATPEKPPTLGRSNSIPGNPQGIQLGSSNWPESVSNSSRYNTPNFDCLAQIFNGHSQGGQNSGHFRYMDGHPAGNNPRINSIAGSFHQSLPEDYVDLSNNMSFTQLLQHGGPDGGTPSNSSLLRFVEMAAERPLMPKPRPETIEFQQDCGSSGFSSGSRFISGIVEEPDISNAHCQVLKSWIGSNSVDLLLREQSQCLSSNSLHNAISLPQTLSSKYL